MAVVLTLVIILLLGVGYAEPIAPCEIVNIQESNLVIIHDYAQEQRVEFLDKWKAEGEFIQNTLPEELFVKLYAIQGLMPVSINYFVVDDRVARIDEYYNEQSISIDNFSIGAAFSSGLRIHMFANENYNEMILLSEIFSTYDVSKLNTEYESVYVLSYYAEDLPEILTTMIRTSENMYISKTQM